MDNITEADLFAALEKRQQLLEKLTQALPEGPMRELVANLQSQSKSLTGDLKTDFVEVAKAKVELAKEVEQAEKNGAKILAEAKAKEEAIAKAAAAPKPTAKPSAPDLPEQLRHQVLTYLGIRKGEGSAAEDETESLQSWVFTPESPALRPLPPGEHSETAATQEDTVTSMLPPGPDDVDPTTWSSWLQWSRSRQEDAHGEHGAASQKRKAEFDKWSQSSK